MMGIFDSIKRKLGYDIKNSNGVNEEYDTIYNNGKKVGKVIRKKYYTRNGEKHGSCQYYWKGHISAEGNFTNGEESGEIKKYFRVEDELKDIKNHPQLKEFADIEKGVYEAYSLDGKLLERSKIKGVKFEQGSSSSNDGFYGGIYPIRSGLCEKWFENGKLKEKGFWGKNSTSSIYNLSHRKGEHVQFHSNGNEFKKGTWKNKVPEGLHKFFYPKGNIEFEIEFASFKGNRNDSSHPRKEESIKEKWYNENGTLMGADEIIKKAGIDPRRKFSARDGIRVNWAHDSLNQENFIDINDLKFKRKGEVKFYGTLGYQIGHSYELI